MSDSTVDNALEELKVRRKHLSAEIGLRKKQGEPVGDLLEQSKALSEQIAGLESQTAPEAESARPAPARPDDAPSPAVACTVLAAPDQVLDLRVEWQDLLGRSNAASPFLSWEFMSAWYRQYAAEGEMHCLAVREPQGRLVGLAPLFLSGRRDRVLPAGHLGLAATYGPSWGTYLEIVAEEGREREVTRAVLGYLVGLRGRWRLVRLVRVPAESATVAQLLTGAAEHGLRATVSRGAPCLTGRLPASAADYAATTLSGARRKMLRRALQHLERDHPPVSFRQCRDADELEDYVAAMTELDIGRRAGRTALSNFLDPGFRSCFGQALREFWRAGWLRVEALECGGRVIAVESMLLYRRRLYLLQGGFDRDFAEYSPSHLVVTEAIKRAIADGAVETDWLAGDHPYKTHYAPDRREVLDVVLWEDRLPGAWPVAREILRRAGRATAKQLLRPGSARP